ncbi:molybdenum cofactor guanylyltransferase MobA [Qingshengfaniella alkalisoli]|uniref:Molybdenum cofactor guanylyltransferase n=1 Tax=Qingshengfaniella alkalisoli TaxID=2599296 RepID=A0A5B8IVQ0_9RHOB|nr:molybdenum cofactor guanylyltransferase MobA [Qingshengfaniella alkalisoli]QDY68578.1 molybdenum cofactor guanylyltransferase MobA [Qingshengfaniella alkalisoli]
MKAPLGVILAGGLARRMGGRDKGLLSLGGRPILSHVIDRLSPQVTDLVLNANGDPARFASFGLPVVADTTTGFPGPLAGVLAGMERAAEAGLDHIVTVAADTPFFPCDLVPRLQLGAEASGLPLSQAATVTEAATPRIHPTFGLWPVVLRDDLRECLQSGMRKIVLWTERHGCAPVLFPRVGFDPFFNVNTPDDLDRAEELITEHTS